MDQGVKPEPRRALISKSYKDSCKKLISFHIKNRLHSSSLVIPKVGLYKTEHGVGFVAHKLHIPKNLGYCTLCIPMLFNIVQLPDRLQITISQTLGRPIKTNSYVVQRQSFIYTLNPHIPATIARATNLEQLEHNITILMREANSINSLYCALHLN